MIRQQQILSVKFLVTIIMVVLIYIIYTHTNVFTNFQNKASTIDPYAYARTLTINGTIDPTCLQVPKTYGCAGLCPWANTKNKELVMCSFLPRIPHPDFVKHNIYCTPEPDQCPTYNAWLKDSLPLTTQHIKEISAPLALEFTLGGYIPIDYSSQQYRAGDAFEGNWTIDLIENYRKILRTRGPYGNYYNLDIYPALEKYGLLAVRNKKCAVIGTEFPWIESALLEYNASTVTTVEYAKIHTSVPRLKTITPTEFARKQQHTDTQEFFDSVWSYSSIEHDGLGRYRDPINPHGDFQTMVKITCILKPGGLLFLGVPINIYDFIQFNLHRIYGPIRLPLLYRYFHIVEVLGGPISQTNMSTDTQYFVVLQNKLGCKST